VNDRQESVASVLSPGRLQIELVSGNKGHQSHRLCFIHYKWLGTIRQARDENVDYSSERLDLKPSWSVSRPRDSSNKIPSKLAR
jgi:hypothetical protein